MEIREQIQRNPVADEESAITAVVRPILHGLLYSLKKDVVETMGGYEKVPLKMLPRLRRPGDGDTGICFEYAAHDAVRRGEPAVIERISDALSICNVRGDQPSSILFGAEKNGSQALIDTAQSLLTSESRLLSGVRGQPIKLKRHISAAMAAFRKKGVDSSLPQSISGLWRADLFLGNSDTDYWVGTSVKINPSKLTGDKGLRIGLVPAAPGLSDSIRSDAHKNLVVCPLPYDGEFVETFYKAWETVVAFLDADAQVPKPVSLPRPAARTAARYLADRREFTVLEAVDALNMLAQPELLDTHNSSAEISKSGSVDASIYTLSLLAPKPTGLTTA